MPRDFSVAAWWGGGAEGEGGGRAGLPALAPPAILAAAGPRSAVAQALPAPRCPCDSPLQLLLLLLLLVMQAGAVRDTQARACCWAAA